MASLGEFGAELATVDDDGDGPDTFLFHGHEFELPAKVSSLPMLRFAYNAQHVAHEEQKALAAEKRARTDEQRAEARRLMAEVELVANAGLYQYLRDMLPADWDRFEQVAASVGAGEQELLDVASKIMAAVSGRPTRRSSGSPAGPSPIGGTSTDASPSQPASTGSTVIYVPAEPVETPLERARREIDAESMTVAELARSGG